MNRSQNATETTSDDHVDYYVAFLRNSRWRTPAQQQQKARWLKTLKIENSAAELFRFESLLKGLVCWGNPSNHPGFKALTDEDVLLLENKDFNNELETARDTVEAIVDTGIRLSPEERAIPRSVGDIFCALSHTTEEQRVDYLKQRQQVTHPEDDLCRLIGDMQDLQTLMDGLRETSAVSYKQYAVVTRIAYSGIMESTFFNPLSPFEFDELYDSIDLESVRVTIDSIESAAARKISAVTLISLFRMLRSLTLIDDQVSQCRPGEASEMIPESQGQWLALSSALYSEARRLAAFLSKDAATWISRDFGQAFSALPSKDIHRNFDELHLQFAQLKSLRELLESTGHQLSLELKKAFSQKYILGDVKGVETNILNVSRAIDTLNSFVKNAIVLLLREFNINLKGDDVFEDFTSDFTRSTRLRRDIWMFRQILKAFTAKTIDSEELGDRWAGLNTFKYVQTFVNYFRSMGYQLLRYSDYDRFDKFMVLIDRLREGDVLEAQRMSHVVEECEAFYQYLDEMFEAVGLRKELCDVPFDAKDAARTLKLFIE